MSYETNPILNRIKLSKGWKTSSFPTNSLDYSRDTRLWFKVYLFLKVYLLLHGIRLLKGEIRVSDAHTKVLYLSVLKQSTSPRKSKSKWKTKSLLQSLRSSLTLTHNKKARFLLYLDLQKLKKKSFFFFNQSRKKTFSHIWITKPRPSSWINSSYLLHTWRMQFKLKQQLIWKKKHQLRSKNICFSVKKKKISSLRNDHEIFFCITAERKKQFWQKKQRSIFSLLTKVQKNIFFFEQTYTLFWYHMRKAKNVSVHNFIQTFVKQLQKKRLFLKQVNQIYQLIQKRNVLVSQKQVTRKTTRKTFSKKLKQVFHYQKIQLQQKLFLLNFRKNFRNFQKNVFFSSKYPKRIFLWKDKYLITRNKNLHSEIPFFDTISNSLMNLQKKTLLLPVNVRSFFSRKKIKNLREASLLVKTKFFKKTRQIKPLHIFLWKRITQKKKFPVILKKRKVRKSKKQSSVAYRLSYRQNYRKFLNLSTTIKLKYLLEDLLKNYFSIVVHIKISWPLAQFKNLKFYRLLFPTYKYRILKNKPVSLKISKANRQRLKKYIYLGQSTRHFKIFSNILINKTNKKKSLRGLKKIENQPQVGVILNFWQTKKKKKNKYLIRKTKIIQTKNEKRLAWPSKASFTSELVTTLTWFVKYLDPQPVVDHLAKIIGATKKHVTTLKLIETVLRTFNLKRGLGYRIALIGRINGANKSRAIYLRKLNRNRSRQSFSKNVNFALAHARATIGTFAIKLWIYS